MSEPSKDTIYIDVDEEITGIIDKVQSSDKKIVALVLPKRATVLQSVVNMKLLKRTASRSKKNLVLITSEAGLMPLAGAVGLHVAKNLTSKPEIPDGPPKDEIPESLVNEEEIDQEPEDEEPELDKAAAVGVLAGTAVAAGAAKNVKAAEPDEDISDDVAKDTPAAAAADAKPEKAAKTKKSKKDKSKDPNVPNFEKFRKLFLIGGAVLIGLIVFLYFAIAVWPKATITIDAQASKLNTEVTFTADTTAKTTDVSQSIVPAQVQQSKKVSTQNAPATGSKNIGNKASGTISVKNCEDSSPHTLPGGTIFTGGGLNYASASTVVVPPSTVSHGVVVCGASVQVSVTATSGGANYNQNPTTYTTNQLAGNFTITGSAMTGGSDNTVKVVSQADIEGAKAQLANSSDPNAQAELTKQLQSAGMYVIPNSFNAGAPVYTTNVNAGDQADSVTVTSTITYTLLGVNEDGMKAVIEDSAKKQIDTSKQMILSDGLSGATYTVENPTDPKPKVTVQTAVVVGPKINTDQIKKDVAGKKSADTRAVIEAIPGVKSVTVKYSPFWVTKTPSNPDKITIVFKQASDK